MVVQKERIWRIGLYLLGMVLLALGITMTAQAGLGASAIVSVPFTLSRWLGLNFANLTLIVYCLFVGAEFFIKGKARSWLDLLQIPVSIIFTRFMAVFQLVIRYESGYLPTDIGMLLAGIVLTGVGAAMTVDMQLIPNPGDGIVSSISLRSGRPLGLCKNFFDLGCVTVSLVMGALAGNPLLGVGGGTFVSMIAVGRVMAVFQTAAKERVQRAAGLECPVEAAAKGLKES